MVSGLTSIQKLADRALIFLFIGAIWLPLFVSLVGLAPERTGKDRRQAPCPALSLSGDVLAAFPAKFEEYFDKCFGLRHTLIRWYSMVKLRWLGGSAAAQVIVGRDGWLFYSPRPLGVGQPLEEPFQPDELARWRHVLQMRAEWLAARDIPYLLVIVPDKQTIYPEMLPPALRRRPSASRLDQLLAHLPASPNLVVLDLREPLLRAKATERVYYRTDSHWNRRGAFVGYQQILAVLSRWLPDVQALPRSAFVPTAEDQGGGDLAAMLRLEDQMHEERLGLAPLTPRLARPTHEVVPIEECYRLGHLQPLALDGADPHRPRALMLCDSFTQQLIPLLSEHFSRIVYLPEYVLEPASVERERPQVVIQEMVERTLTERNPENVGAVQDGGRRSAAKCPR